MCEDHSPFSSTQKDRIAEGRSKRRMDIELIRRVLADSVGTPLREIIPSTMGEPLVYRHFDEILDLCAEYDVKMNLTTNGTFPQRGPQAWAERIVSGGVRRQDFLERRHQRDARARHARHELGESCRERSDFCCCAGRACGRWRKLLSSHLSINVHGGQHCRTPRRCETGLLSWGWTESRDTIFGRTLRKFMVSRCVEIRKPSPAGTPSLMRRMRRQSVTDCPTVNVSSLRTSFDWMNTAMAISLLTQCAPSWGKGGVGGVGWPI